MMPENVKRMIKPAVLGVLYIIVLLNIIRLLKLNTYNLVLFLTLNSALFFIITKRKDIKNKSIGWKEYITHIIKSFFTIALFVIIIKYLGGYGVIGFVLIIVFVVVYKLLKQKTQYLEAIKTIETMIWNKPLDKNLWKNKEFKNTKVKFVWRKKNEN